ncbi:MULTISPECIES: hypothetical protein [Niastella]|uniref:Uncharacterized protein n=1 Tax=Niastella soli TaxID=2821487 RepID=A0ABS3YYG3_9BACT|nr:hypothetical protein [Niastella soli]MBO9202958.1 hypothetical protein [Niastella soli]
MVRFFWIILISLIPACKQPITQNSLAATIPNYTTPAPAHLPQPLTDYFKSTFPQWRVVEKSDFSTTWWSFYDSSYNPCWARTDINDDQLADYAVWLKNNAQYKLVICMGATTNSFTHYIIDDIHTTNNNGEHQLETGVAVAPPAQIDVVLPHIQSLVLQSNGFVLMELEIRTRIYYWQNDSLQTFYMK